MCSSVCDCDVCGCSACGCKSAAAWACEERVWLQCVRACSVRVYPCVHSVSACEGVYFECAHSVSTCKSAQFANSSHAPLGKSSVCARTSNWFVLMEMKLRPKSSGCFDRLVAVQYRQTHFRSGDSGNSSGAEHSCSGRTVYTYLEVMS
jgi:hypothetical protein